MTKYVAALALMIAALFPTTSDARRLEAKIVSTCYTGGGFNPTGAAFGLRFAGSIGFLFGGLYSSSQPWVYVQAGNTVYQVAANLEWCQTDHRNETVTITIESLFD